MIERNFCEKTRNSKKRIENRVLLIVLGSKQQVDQITYEKIKKEYVGFNIQILKINDDSYNIKNKINHYMKENSLSKFKGDIVLYYCDIVVQLGII